MYSNFTYSVIENLESGSSGLNMNAGGSGGNFFRHGGLGGSSSNSQNTSDQPQTSSDQNNYTNVDTIQQSNNTDNQKYNRKIIKSQLNKGKVEIIDESKSNKIVVAYPIYGEPMSFINIKGEKDGLSYHIWNKIHETMKLKGNNFEIEYVIVKEPKVDDLVEGLRTRKYDIVIGDYGTNPNFMSDVSYTSPFMSIKDVGVYPEGSESQYEYRLIKKIVSVLFWPFIGLILLSLLSSIYAWIFSKKFNPAGAFIQMMNGILGDRGALMTGTQFTIKPGKNFTVWIMSIIILIASFAFLFYLQSIAISKSLDIISKNKDPFLYPEGKKVLVPRGSTALQTLKDCCGIVTVEAKSKTTDVDTIAKEFSDREKKENLSGFYHSGPEVSKWISKRSDFIMSETKFSVPSPVSFMVSKYKPELLYEMNKSIAEINWEGTLNDTCKEYINRLCFSTQY
jgi:ABC-type amino acid transport substrate-binding protein